MRGHSSLLSNLWCTASKPEAPRIYKEHLSMILRTRIRLRRMSAKTNDCSLFPLHWGRCPEGAERALPGKLNENRGKSDASRRIYDGIEAAAFPAIPIEPAFSIAPSSHSPHSLNLQFLKKSVKRPSFYGIIIVTDEETQV